MLLDFWAAWCGPCREQLPSLAGLSRELRDQDFALLGVDDDEMAATALSFFKENGYDWPSLFDGADHAARGKYKITAITTLVLIGASGKLVAIESGSGAASERAIRAALRSLGFRLSE